ncbi:MAG: chemotaxis protein CheW [Halobacteriovoraceae bacterium]|nr:chemotaxis protein CheW [Halobacteriovoraceae bacterium]
MSEDDNPILKEFLIESFENLSNISDELTRYEQDVSNSELLNSIYRKVHTLKGSASFLGLKKLEKITHISENILDYLREGTLNLNSNIIDVLYESFDTCLSILKVIENSAEEGDGDYSELLSKLEKTCSGDEIENLEELKFQKYEKMNNSALENLKLPENVTPITKSNNIENKSTGAACINRMKDENTSRKEATNKTVKPNQSNLKKFNPRESLIQISEKVEKNTSQTQQTMGPRTSLKDSVVRVNVQLLDKIMNVVGELVLNRNQILQFANNFESADLNRLAQQLNVITTELQTDIMTTRMQPVGSVLNKFERVVRDLARSQNKKIKLEISGQDTELDKTLLEAIKDPMTHLVRNSTDHGIELPDVRVEKGKEETGKVTIRAYHEGGQVTIEISDDGNGLAKAKILNKALSKGLITQERAERLSDKQILDLIFTAGFSTAEQVTNISGRGVGMDVVRTNIEKIGGSIDIDSTEGEGTTFKLRIPLTLAIVPALVIMSGGRRFSIPQTNLVELVMLEDNEKNLIEKIHNSEFYRLRGELIPIFRLNDHLGLVEGSSTNLYEENINIVILNADGQTYGLIVDVVLDTEEIVVKPLSRKLKILSLYGGATIMGDGQVSLIIDALGFYNTVNTGHILKGEEKDKSHAVKTDLGVDITETLLFELADNRPYAIALSLINRLEEIDSSIVEWSGDIPLVRYRGTTMPLVSLEKKLDLNIPSILEDKSVKIIPALVVKIKDKYVGFVVKEINDIAISTSEIDFDSSDREGIMGTLFVNEKTVTLVDIYTILEKSGFVSRDIEKGTAFKNQTILVVDDSQMYRKVIKDLVEEFGAKVLLARDGLEGLEVLKKEEIDLVISDIEMPHMDGWSFAKEVRRSSHNYKDIPLIALTTRFDQVDLRKSKEVGFTQHLEKLNKEDIIETIKQLIA